MLSNHTPLIPHLLDRRPAGSRSFLNNALLVFVGSALLAVCGQVSFYLPWNLLVPITLQTFGVLLIGALYGPRLGAATVVAYLAEGLAGLPVFAGGRSAWSPSSFVGLPVIVGPTAGYLLACPLAAALVGVFARRGWDRKLRSAIPAMLLGNLVILAGGFGWLFVATWLLNGNANLATLLNLAVVPFLPGDLLKVLLAAVTLPGAWALIRGHE